MILKLISLIYKKIFKYVYRKSTIIYVAQLIFQLDIAGLALRRVSMSILYLWHFNCS